MPNKYYDTISKIKAGDNFKEKLIANLVEESQKMKIEENERKYVKKEGIIMKIKKAIIAIISALAILAGSGVAYAALGGTINGVPVLEWMGIKFSKNYTEYVEPVENQVIENEDVKVALEATVSDEGFTILQFRVNISEEKLNSYKTEEDIESGWEVPFCYLSFNDPVINDNGYKYTELNGENYNLIIDGEYVWVRGKSAQSVEEISESEYLVYQMWFLDNATLNNKKEFEITLKDVSIGLGEDCIAVDGGFKVDVSKEKALNNTKTIVPKDDTTLAYKKMEKSIQKISVTPLQTIIKVKNVYKDVNQDDLTYVLDEDYVGMINYEAFDQNDNAISVFATETETRIIYEDGTVEEGIPGEFEFSKENFEHATYEIIEMLAVEQSEDIKEINLKVYETSDYYETVKNIMEYKINLKNNKIEKANKDIVIENTKNDLETDEYEKKDENFYNLVSDSFKLDSDIDYIEIKVENKMSTNGIEYTYPVIIKDSTVINELTNIINNSVEYNSFEEEFGAGGFFEGSPILTIHLKNGKKLWTLSLDDLSSSDNGESINIMAVHHEDDDRENSKMYKVNSKLSAFLENTYNTHKNDN